MIDDRVQIIEKEAYTIADAMSATGGFLEILDIIVLMLIGGIQENMFNTSLVKRIFKINNPEQASKNKKANKGLGKLSP